MSLETFKSKVLPTKDKLFRFALRMLRDEDEALDAVQEIMIKVWDKRDSIDSWNNVEAWCMTMTKNHIYDKIKSKRHQLTNSIEEGFDVKDNKSQTPASITETNDTMNYISTLIATLPEKQQQIIQLRDIEGYSYQEIGDIMKVDINQVKVNLFRARKSVKEKLTNINAYGL